jgi:hypothetical protein
MAITGGIKFFKKSKALDATVSAPISGNASAINLLNNNKETFYRSSGSSDSTTEEIEVNFAEEKVIDRIFIKNFNGKSFDVMYDVAGVWTHFSSVVDVDGSQSNITETTYSRDTYYAEFSSVSTTKLRIRINTTQVVDAEKFINQIIATEEIATLVGYPDIKQVQMDRNQRSKKTVSGKYSIQKSLEIFQVKLAFNDYPSSDVYNVDIDAMIDLHDSEDPFIVWLCGGRQGTEFFKYTLPGFRLRDTIQMQVKNAYKLKYTNNIYINPLNLASVDLVEHI